MYAVLTAAFQWLLTTILGQLFLKGMMFLGLNIAFQFIVTQITGMGTDYISLNPLALVEIMDIALQSAVGAVGGLGYFIELFHVVEFAALTVNAYVAAWTIAIIVRTIR